MKLTILLYIGILSLATAIKVAEAPREMSRPPAPVLKVLKDCRVSSCSHIPLSDKLNFEICVSKCADPLCFYKESRNFNLETLDITTEEGDKALKEFLTLWKQCFITLTLARISGDKDL